MLDGNPWAERQSDLPNASDAIPGRIALIILDVDGTLLDSNHQISHGVSSAIQTSQLENVQVTLASGRNQSQIHDLAAELRISTPVISLGGACISSPNADTPIWHKTFSKKLVHSLVIQAREIELGIMVQTLDANFLEADLQIIGPELKYILDAMEVHRDAFGSHVEGKITDFVTIVEDILECMSKLPSKLTFIGDAQGISSLQLSLEGKPVRASLSGQNYLDVTPEDADKGAAVRQLLTMMNFDPKVVAAVGDGHNDISMFREVAFPIAMGNSLEEVQRSARLTAPRNDQEGVAWAIHTILQHNRTL